MTLALFLYVAFGIGFACETNDNPEGSAVGVFLCFILWPFLFGALVASLLLKE